VRQYSSLAGKLYGLNFFFNKNGKKDLWWLRFSGNAFRSKGVKVKGIRGRYFWTDLVILIV
jgi:hypothetical protein